jgi:hypothetical protein
LYHIIRILDLKSFCKNITWSSSYNDNMDFLVVNNYAFWQKSIRMQKIIFIFYFFPIIIFLQLFVSPPFIWTFLLHFQWDPNWSHLRFQKVSYIITLHSLLQNIWKGHLLGRFSISMAKDRCCMMQPIHFHYLFLCATRTMCCKSMWSTCNV